MAICGLDFGTSNSTVALPSGEVLEIDRDAVEARLFRSVLYFPEGEPGFFSGARAIREYLSQSEGRFIQSVKTWLPSPTFQSTQIRGRILRLQDLVAMLLRTLRLAAERESGLELSEVVLGRPAVFSTDPEREELAERRLREAAELAGFVSVRFLIEPIAAALSYEAGLDHDELVLVADFGAGTSDVTLMRLGPTRSGHADRRADVIAVGGVSIGGDRFDAEIMRHKLLPYFGAGSTYEIDGKRMPFPFHISGKLLDWHEMSFIREKKTLELLDRMLRGSDRVPAMEALEDLVKENLGYRLFRAIEKTKIELSHASESVIEFDEARVQIKEPITRKEFDQFTAPLLASLSECVEDVLRRSGKEAERVDAVFLTGGSSQIPSVQRLFRDRFGESRLRTADAFTSVAAGLGRSAGAT